MDLGVALSKHPEHAARIGALIARWNAIEDVSAHLFALFAGTGADQSVALVHSVQGAHSRIGLVKGAGEYVLAEHPRLGEFYALMEQLSVLSQTRNRYVHATFAVSEDGKPWILNRREDWRVKQEGGKPLTLAEIDVDVGRMDKAFNDVIRLQNDLSRDPFLAALRQASQQTNLEVARLRRSSHLKPESPDPTT